MKRQSLWISSMLVLIMGAAAPITRADVVIDLKTGIVTETFATAPNPAPVSATGVYTTTDNYARIKIDPKANGCTSTPYEAVAELNLSPSGGAPLTRLSVTVEYEGTPSGWTTHLGDDANNDGYGGGTSLQGVAEAHVINETFYVYSTGLSAGVVEKLLESRMRISEGALHFNVTDQKVTVGQPYTVVDSNVLKQLFDLSSTAADRKLYLGLNRVIRDGSPRKGCGARRVILSFEN